MGYDKTRKTTTVTGPGGGPVATVPGSPDSFRVTTLDVTGVATAIPAAPLTGRLSLTITNTDAVETLYLGAATVTADSVVGVTSGHELPPSESINLDLDDSAVLYGRTTGATVRVKVLELAV